MQWNTAISCVGNIYSHLTISSRLITMPFLDRFTADCSSFSSMKDLRWVLLKVIWLSWVYCRSETNTAHYSDKTFQYFNVLTAALGWSLYFQSFVRSMSPQKHFLFFMIRGKTVIHTFANVILFCRGTSIVTQAKLLLIRSTSSVTET